MLRGKTRLLFNLAFLVIVVGGGILLYLPSVHSVSRTAAASSLTCGGWSIVPSPNVAGTNNYLDALATVSANNLWAVGYTLDPVSNYDKLLIEHWNGQTWSIVNGPTIGSTSALHDATVVPKTGQVWAVGHSDGNTLIEQWNGKTWRIVPSPNVAGKNSWLSSVTALSANDIWATGRNDSTDPSYDTQTLIEHWNGKQWSIVPSPNAGSELNEISAVSANNIWAVGTNTAEHWDGTKWSIIAAPFNGTDDSITAISANNVWAAGSTFDSNTSSSQAGIKQWDGTKWSIVSTPPTNGRFSSITARSANDIWAVGASSVTSSPGNTLSFIPLIEHWNGYGWTIITGPSPTQSGLSDVAPIAPKNVWTVGDYSPNGLNGNAQTLIEHYC